ISGHGDSGGPIFVNGAVAGVVSYGVDPGEVPDYDGVVESGSFGEWQFDTRVSSYLPFLNPILTPTAASNLVFDMATQALGVQELWVPFLGNIPWADDITIIVQKVGANLQISVTDPLCAQFSGVYFSGPANLVNDLTIRGQPGGHTTV